MLVREVGAIIVTEITTVTVMRSKKKNLSLVFLLGTYSKIKETNHQYPIRGKDTCTSHMPHFALRELRKTQPVAMSQFEMTKEGIWSI